ncbi:toxin-antitoxin system HicB family antitoxin [Rhodococcus sp. Eu-32]|uniref:toxin-antitoxin system HicB family antitoxin n=1 Tax=Rhodococcus sp. Eu-32 TaxID=1017319 RepID=UPI000DF387E7|nr:toxin-antitoxin system HicB family antitoxin [Rhodococcus sp. Eu-32]RRQ26818.1 toxin-antitoxin system HicB family antitoxin [Rhodococcus sp. Eu-32]
MELDSYTASLRADLLAAAALGDERTRQTADALGSAAQASARLMLLQALSDFAEEISALIDGHSVHLRLTGNEAVADVTRDVDPAETEATTPEPEDYPTMEDVTGEMRRVTLRMVEHVKERAEEAASMNGVSLNSWLSQAVQGALRDQMRKERPY